MLSEAQLLSLDTRTNKLIQDTFQFVTELGGNEGDVEYICKILKENLQLIFTGSMPDEIEMITHQETGF